MADNEAKALQLLADAEKKLTPNKSFLGNILGNSSAKQDEALDMLGRAANLFKMAKKWSQAGSTFVTLSEHHAKLGNKHDSATSLVDAANCYKKTNGVEAANCLERAVSIYTEMGRFSIAAKHCQSVAELYETDIKDSSKARMFYEQAADYFKGEEAKSSANKCMLKVAAFAADAQEYDRAIQIYEEVASSALESSLLKYSAKDHFFKALLCHLCVDVLNAQHALTRYQDQFPALADSREAKLISSLIGHVEDRDGDNFSAEVAKFDKISRLESWHTSLLLRIKRQLTEGEDDLR